MLRVKVAETDLLASIIKLQVPELVQAPLHPAKVEPVAGVAVRVTPEPKRKFELQVEPQLSPEGELETIPEPVPVFVTVILDESITKVALTVLFASSVKVH